MTIMLVTSLSSLVLSESQLRNKNSNQFNNNKNYHSSRSRRSRPLDILINRIDKSRTRKTIAQQANYIKSPSYLGVKYIMPVVSSVSSVSAQLNLKPMLQTYTHRKSLTPDYHQGTSSNKKYKFHHETKLPLKFDFYDHRPKDKNLIGKIYQLGATVPKKIFENTLSFALESAKHRIEDEPSLSREFKRVVPQLIDSTQQRLLKKDKSSDQKAKQKHLENQVPPSAEENDNSDKRPRDASSDDGKGTSSNTEQPAIAETVAEDSIVNEPITKGRTNRLPRLDFASNGSKQTSNQSSYDSSDKKRSLATLSITGKTAKSTNGAGGNDKSSKLSKGVRTAAIILEPSLESIAMRILSSAATKSRSNAPSTSSSLHSSGLIGSPSQSSDQSLLSSLSSTLLSTAINHLLSVNSSSGSSSLASTSSSPSSAAAASSPSWPNKLVPILQHSITSLSGLTMDELPNLPSTSSFLHYDLSPSESASIQSSHNGTASGKPHTSKQNSPAITGLIHLARYMLGKY